MLNLNQYRPSTLTQQHLSLRSVTEAELSEDLLSYAKEDHRQPEVIKRRSFFYL